MDQTVLTRSYGKPRQKTIKYVDYVVVNLLAQVGKRLKLGSAFNKRDQAKEKARTKCAISDRAEIWYSEHYDHKE